MAAAAAVAFRTPLASERGERKENRQLRGHAVRHRIWGGALARAHESGTAVCVQLTPRRSTLVPASKAFRAQSPASQHACIECSHNKRAPGVPAQSPSSSEDTSSSSSAAAAWSGLRPTMENLTIARPTAPAAGARTESGTWKKRHSSLSSLTDPVVLLLLAVRVHEESLVRGGHFEGVLLARLVGSALHSEAAGQVDDAMRGLLRYSAATAAGR